jgi:hypothetical protein
MMIAASVIALVAILSAPILLAAASLRLAGTTDVGDRCYGAFFGSPANRLPFPKKSRAWPQVVTIASPRPSTSSFVCGSFSCAAAFISCRLCMVTILAERFAPGFGMEREYRGSLV